MIQLTSYLLFDGAMGTYYASVTNSSIQRCELANIQSPNVICRIHEEYLNAGAQAIKTNTFSANTVSVGLDFSKIRSIIRAGFDIAMEAAAPKKALVFADIGPIPNGSQNGEYFKIIDTFLKCGAKHFLFETFGEYRSVLDCAEYIKKADPECFILSQYAVSPDGYTRKGIPISEIFGAMESNCAIDAYGLNCICGPKHIYENLKKLGKRTKPLSAMPNAGYPYLLGERTVYRSNADYFASVMSDIYALGTRILGGCCGTTPEHIARMKESLTDSDTCHTAFNQKVESAFTIKKVFNGFRSKLESGQKIIAVELDPPLNADISKTLENAKAVKEAGADIITIADNPLARARADSAMIAAKIKRECGIETLPHIACRDRNLNAIKALLLGLHIEDIRNILTVTGDPVPEADRTDIKSVYNLNSKMFAAFVRDLNTTVFAGDEMLVGAALNINANRPELELKRAQEKIESGVNFFLTQPVLSEKAADIFRQARSCLSVKLIAGIMPLVSYKNALFIRNEVAGITIEDETVRAFENKTRDESEKLGIELSMNVIKEISPFADGYYLITPLNRVHVIIEIISKIKAGLF